MKTECVRKKYVVVVKLDLLVLYTVQQGNNDLSYYAN